MIILASASLRRQELLRQIACDFRVVISHAAEDNHQGSVPEELVVYNARAKAVAVAKSQADNLAVLGADTIVVLDGYIYGKPADKADAVRMLHCLSGKTHEVYTGIALVRGDQIWCDVQKTKVTIAAMTSDEIERYVDTGEPLDKAGGYAIQGIASAFVEGIEGCYTNVVGLPLHTLCKLSKKAGINL